ncbi:glutamate synthase domain-containing protein 2 [Chitinophaga terrae (ex Kim and Jung 2007)]|uniref:FMN-binding glutamate synthase family protein n=1 Tax=Chitinophaga terrae (ex Kim and Jung 2007) TaxID=408074 RepID=UPI00277E7150|nr:FMN-binding glutamate synthase family protein [Chitinophaga terrae (ex Kim and Jung 2007)]MDQ0105839.1 glutamate synthase domain-containing protein 2 [Chitinophaga terrae (ex Kim and Jung 2007)]
MAKAFLVFSAISLAVVIGLGLLFPWVNWLLILVVPIVVMGLLDMFQKKHAIMRNYPIVGRMRFWMEALRPKIYQYFVESDIDGSPINRVDRSTIYQRAKRELNSQPFGTQFNVYAEGYEWMAHSIQPRNFDKMEKDPRVLFGGRDCKQPYSASILNVSAMSYGSLSSNAVQALNGGAKLGNFAHNTGEGGISDFHLKQGGDIIWQIGTGYFGCRDANGNFSPSLFAEKTALPQVKMIELKISQGAKPGHGGILPAAKNTPEIAAIRHVEPYTTVFSPPYHTAFGNPKEMMYFIKQMRELSEGKPVGFKLCIGQPREFYAICKAMIETDIYPDFITVDGGEGGTGAAPPEFSNSVGMPLMDGLAFVHDTLVGFNIRHHMKLIASGKILTGFHILRAMALGADTCNSARAMMMALGCIQALVCNTNKCPTGVATQDKWLAAGLVVDDKKQRVANYHQDTVESAVELAGAAGLRHPHDVTRSHIYRRVFMNEIRTFEDIYPAASAGSLLNHPSVQHVATNNW